MNIKKTTKIIISLIFLFFVISAASAQLIDTETAGQLQDNTELVGKSGGLGQASVGSIIATIIRVALGLLGAIFLSLMIYAGFQWMTAAGNETKVKKAQEIIQTSIIGLVIVLAAYAITYFVFTYLPFSGSGAGASNNNGGGGGT